MSEKVADAKVKLSLEDKLTTPLKRVQKKFDTLSKKLSHSLSIPRFSAAVKNMTTSLHGVQSALGIVANRASIFTGVLGLAGGGLVASLTALTMKTMHMGDSLYHASKHLGMSVASLQLWGDAADNSGYSAELFQQSLATLNRRSAQAYAGQKRGIMGFEALGISVKNASGQLKSNSVLLEEITEKMSKMKNQAQRQRIAALLFGGDGKEMAAMLAQGMAPIKELFAKARKGKWLIGADVARYAADLSDKLGAFKKKIGGIANFIGARFMPVINDMIDAFSKLIDENRDLIQTTVTHWAKALKQTLKDLLNPTSDLRKGITNITERIKGWCQWLKPLIGEITLFKVGLIALGSFILGPLVAALAAAGAAFVTLGITIMTTPIGWILGGITALVVGGYLLYKNWDKINGWLVASFTVVGIACVKLTNILVSRLLSALTSVGSACIKLAAILGKSMLSALTTVASAVIKLTITLARSLLSALVSVISAISSLVATLVSSLVSAITAAISAVAGLVATLVGSLISAITAAISAVAGLVATLVGSLISAITAAISAVAGLVATLVGSLISAITAAISAIAGLVATLVGSLISAITAVISAVAGLVTTLVGSLVSAITAAISAIAGLVATLVGSLISAIAAVSSAFISLGIAIMTTPVGWIIGGIAALVAAGYLLYKNWDTVINFLRNLWNSFASLCSNIFNNLFMLFKNFSPLSWVSQKVNTLIKWLFEVNLTDAGSHIIEGLWDGIKSKWNALSDWLGNQMNKLTSWMPNWMKEKTEFSATINKTSTQTIKALTDETNTRAKRMVDAVIVPNAPSGKAKSSSNTGIVETGQMQATNVKVETFKVPEPIMVHKPTEVNAPITITNLNISSGSGSPQDIHAAVSQALERYARQQRLAIASSLSD